MFHGSFFYLSSMQLLGCGRPARAGRTSRNERDGSDPPLLPLVRHAVGGGMFQAMFHTLYPPFGGRFRPIYPGGKASDKAPNTNPQLARNSPKENLMKWRVPVLIFGGLCCSAWGFI